MKRMMTTLALLFIFLSGCTHTMVQTGKLAPETGEKPGILVFIDDKTHEHVREELTAYLEALRYDGMKPTLFSKSWENPGEIKDSIIAMIDKNPATEGAVFVGDIPIPMIRDAQHLTSAFKMDPVRFKDMQRSSIASDRFYDDPDLRFDFISQDTSDSRLFYYSLRPDSPQRIEKDIYSGRIISPRHSDEKYEDIAAYLKKAAEAKYESNALDHAITFAGHGYHSESLSAWEDQLNMLKEQFPQLYLPGAYLKNYYHTMSQDLKSILLDELQHPDLDLAVFHCHGGYDTQYLLGLETPRNPAMAAEYIKRHFRSKVRTARERYGEERAEESRKYYQDAYHVKDEWFEGLYDPESIREDSLYYAAMDIYSSDILKTDPMARMVVFDECFNGQFFKENYISGTYIMEEGATLVGVANTVNVKQDIWPNELIGMISRGARVGQWHQFNTYLENHVIGDPTFHFSNQSRETVWWDWLLAYHKDDVKIWEQLLESEDLTLRGLAVRKVFELEGKAGKDFLVRTFLEDPSENVRLQALKCLAILRTPEFYDLLEKAAKDPSELIRRISMNMMGAAGHERYLPVLAGAVESDVSKRVRFAARGALEIILADEQETCYTYRNDIKTDNELSRINETIQRLDRSSNHRLYDDLLKSLEDTTLTDKEKNRQIRIFRNYQFPEAISVLLKYGASPQESEYIRTVALEALGWYHLNPDAPGLAEGALLKIVADPKTPKAVRKEALKSYNRLKEGANNPITP
ncbi:MAG: HEAT repeat domain-containing protein [Candidatus Marinimicrobia bacterium]|nr:HEAT repeat domain-containing protein [Candidatus Neomarinimicrobiota bacterium]